MKTVTLTELRRNLETYLDESKECDIVITKYGRAVAKLLAENAQHTKAKVNLALEANNKHFVEARDKLERWADDMVYAAEKTLKDTKDKIKDAKRRERQAASLDAQLAIQEEIKTFEKQQRKQREEILR